MADENSSAFSSRPPTKKKATKDEVSKSPPWDSLRTTSPLIGTLSAKVPAYTVSNLVNEGANYKSPYPSLNESPLPILQKENNHPIHPADGNTPTPQYLSLQRYNTNNESELGIESMTPAQGLIQPSSAFKLKSFPETHKAGSQSHSDERGTSAILGIDCNVSTRPYLVFTIQKLCGKQIRRSKPYEGHLLMDKNTTQFFKFFHTESMLITDSLKFEFPTHDEARIITVDNPEDESNFKWLKIDIEEALEEANGTERFKMEVTVPGLEYCMKREHGKF